MDNIGNAQNGSNTMVGTIPVATQVAAQAHIPVPTPVTTPYSGIAAPAYNPGTVEQTPAGAVLDATSVAQTGASQMQASVNPAQASGADDMTPLQSLAKKLSDLKSKFVVEESEDIQQAVSIDNQNINKESAPQPMDNIAAMNAISGVNPVASAPAPELNSLQTSTPVTASATPTPTPTPVQANPISTISPVEQAVPQSQSQPINQQEISENSVQTPFAAKVAEIANKTPVAIPQPAAAQSVNMPILNAQMPDFLANSLNDVEKPVQPSAPVSNLSMPIPSSANTHSADASSQSASSVNIPDNNLINVLVRVKNKRYSYSIDQLLDMVIERNGSDLHLETGYPAMLRVDSVLIPASKDLITEENISELILPVMNEEKRDRLEVNREVDFAYAHGDKARFRVNAFHQRQNMAAAFRLIPNRIKTMEELKLPQIYHQLAGLHQGLVLVTGPTGHGKSTTLASIIQEINMTRDAHILTIEDPIEYIFPPAKALIAQREIQDDTHSWEIALKSALREDPDVILVGEMRDYETISSVITLAETGHLVFATLHTNSASQTIDRIIDVFPEAQQSQVRAQLSNVVEAVIAQRLIPLDRGGRSAASEIMIANPAVRSMIREGKAHQLDNVIRTSADIGMISLETSLVKLVRDGEITMDKAMRYSLRPEEIVRLLKG
jgi:twitching motility protein PilT